MNHDDRPKWKWPGTKVKWNKIGWFIEPYNWTKTFQLHFLTKFLSSYWCLTKKETLRKWNGKFLSDQTQISERGPPFQLEHFFNMEIHVPLPLILGKSFKIKFQKLYSSCKHTWSNPVHTTFSWECRSTSISSFSICDSSAKLCSCSFFKDKNIQI